MNEEISVKKSTNYNVKIVDMYSLQYIDNDYIINVEADDLREPVPMIILGQVKTSNGILNSKSLLHNNRLVIYQNICKYLKETGYKKIYTDEFGEIDI